MEVEREEITNTIRGISSQKEQITILIAHRLSTIRHVDRILVLHKGKLVEDGSHEELLAQRGYYHRLYELQFAEQVRTELK